MPSSVRKGVAAAQEVLQAHAASSFEREDDSGRSESGVQLRGWTFR
jgi:hypothetical protein